MKVLLCTPYNAGPEFEQGGIVVWADNIMDYYHSSASDIQVQVVQFNRKVRKVGGLLARSLGGIKDYGSAIKKTDRQLEDGYDVIHLCTSASFGLLKDYCVLKKAKRKGAKTVVHFHFGRIPELVQKRNWEWWMLQRVLRLTDAAVTMDMKSFDALKACGYRNVEYLPNPLSHSIIRQVENELSSTKRDPHKLLYVGHVIPTKGVFELVEVCKGINGIHLHIIGKVSDEVRTKMIQMAGEGNWLVFEGEVNHQSVIREMLSSGVFVLPSYTEGFPNVILESMACGCTIVATNVGAIPEMLDIYSDAPCGLCCEPKDVVDLRRNIVFFLEHPKEAQQYAGRAIKRVNDMYAISQIWKQLELIWRGTIQTAGNTQDL